MKLITVLIVSILLMSSQVFAELSVSDLEKIREIVKESETRTKDIITSSETRMKEYVSGEVDKINTKIAEMDKRLTNQISEVEKRLTVQVVAVDTQVGRNYNLILGFIALIVFAVGIPQIITALQGRKLREQDAKYEELKQEIETLKQQLIVRP